MATKSKRNERVKTTETIVAIGASAGGLEAINSFFDHAGDMTGYSFVIIQHLSPEHKSFLVELIAKHTALTVMEAGENMLVEPGNVYVIPNRMMMTIRQRRLKLLEKTNDNIPNNAIDVFIKSLAEDQGENAVAVILSGTGSDGTKGVDYIKSFGGQVVIQAPATAKFDGMPNSAILGGNGDVVLPPEEIPRWILFRDQEKLSPGIFEVSMDEEELGRLFTAIHNFSGHEFNYYKTPTILRRIGKRMRYNNLDSPAQYIELLEQDKEEAIQLSKELLINVTSFFRDKEAFDILQREVIPSLVDGRNPQETIKIWVCACSTGEEAYSVAILFDKYIQEKQLQVHVKIFATDIEEDNIQFAAKNSYPTTIEKSVPADILHRYFNFKNDRYSVIPRIRKQVVFARHNVVKDPAFIRNDMICCRNMLIYMNKVLQEKILASFHFSLLEGGVLFLGPSENTSIVKEGFDEVSGKWKIYRKNAKRLQDIFSQKLPMGPIDLVSRYRRPDAPATDTDRLSRDLQKAIVDDLGYVALYIDRQFDIKEAVGDFASFLSLPEKKLKLNLLAMLPREQREVLGTAVRKAWHTGRQVAAEELPAINATGITAWIDPNVDHNHSLTLVVLGRMSVSKAERFNLQREPSAEADNDYIQDLELQLTDTRDTLQHALESMDTTNEELQSANEELLSSNEELQSSNEELQSLNEELHTLNTEHQSKIKELIELNDDLDNYFKSAQTGQIFLDSELNIRRFNTQAATFINLIDSDLNRPFNHISNNLTYPDLQQDIMQVQQDGKIVEKEVFARNGNSSLLRIYPYIRKDKVTDGVVLTFTDITEIKKLYSVVDGVFNSSLSAIIVLATYAAQGKGSKPDFRITAVNYAAEKLVGASQDELLHRSFVEIAPGLATSQVQQKLLQVAETGRSQHFELSVDEEGRPRNFELTVVRLNEGVIITYTDITQRKNAEKRLKRNYNELIAARESLKELNIHLEEEVADRTRELSASEERFRLVSRATNDVIKDWDLVNNFVWKSESFYTLFGYLPEESSDAVDYWFEKIHEEDIAGVKKELFDAINKGKPQWIGEYRFRNGAGEYCHVLERGYIMKDESGMPYRFISSMMDISALKKAEEATRELLNQKDEFMSIASHELKTPITSMKASLQLTERILQEEGDKATVQHFIHKANEQVDKLTTLVENLLDVTKIQAGKIVFNKSDFEIGEVVRDCVYQLQNMTRHKLIVNGDLSLMVHADKNRVEQVVTNLLSNAIKYSPDETDIHVHCQKKGASVLLEVEDKGIGIGKKNIDNVFDRFYRDGDSAKRYSGLGLGLYISADIIRRHSGEIGVVSELGKGSTFWFSLPLESAAN